MPTHRALVVGAGIAGLATALRLRRSGWDVVVVERAPALRGGGYILNFAGVGYAAADRLGLIPALRAVQPAPVDLVHVDSRGGELARMDVAAQQALLGDRTLALFRGDLERVLFDELDDRVEFRFGIGVDRICQHPDEVQVALSDGTSRTVDLLVGTDGVHSRVRSLLFGPEERYRYDFGDIVAITQLAGVPAAVLPGTSVAMDLVGRGVSVINPRGSQAAAFFIFGTDDAGADLAAGPGPTLRRRYGDLGWIVPDLLAAVDDAETVYFDQVSQIRMDRWSVGRTVLVGDAAWCVSLFAGYGSSLAVAGATLLGDGAPGTGGVRVTERHRPLDEVGDAAGLDQAGRHQGDTTFPRPPAGAPTKPHLRPVARGRPDWSTERIDGVTASRRRRGAVAVQRCVIGRPASAASSSTEHGTPPGSSPRSS